MKDPSSKPDLVIYTKWHEKIICILISLLFKHKNEFHRKCIGHLFTLLIAKITIIAGIFLFEDDFNTEEFGITEQSWRILFITSLCLLIPVIIFNNVDIISILTRIHPWDTISTTDNNFYETKNPRSKDSESKEAIQYKPNPIQPLIYSQGQWIIQSNHTNKSNSKQIIRFRGINLPAKTPNKPNKRTKNDDIPTPQSNISFINKPFPLNSAHEHFARISKYGINLLRLTVTWEAVMHTSPGVIDKDYLEYLSSLVDIAAEYGLYVLIDPHQDVWSRTSGGDGAPSWTIDAAGFVTNERRLHESGCAFIHLLRKREDRTKMMWGTNYGKLVCATMFTLFYAGDDFAPGIIVDESEYVTRDGMTAPRSTDKNGREKDGKDERKKESITIQTFLQKYYLQYIEAVAKTMKNKPNVIGFNSMNEPNNGFVDMNLNDRTLPTPFGHLLSYFDGMRLGSGESIECEFYTAPFYFCRREVLNLKKQSVWKSEQHDVWRKLNVYEVLPSGERRLNNPEYFKLKDEEDFTTKYMIPLFKRMQDILHHHDKRFVLYAEPFINAASHETIHAPSTLDANMYGWEPHWYDIATLVLLRYIPWMALDEVKEGFTFFQSCITKMMKSNIRDLKEGNGKLHVMLGEVGVPFDMDIKGHNKMYAASIMALNRTLQAVEQNDFDYILWNYTFDNTNDSGDHWNGEDLSIRTMDENRALLAAVRPFVKSIACHFEILSQVFDPSAYSKTYELKIRRKKDSYLNSAVSVEAAIYIYLPHLHYINPLITHAIGDNTSSPTVTRYDISTQTLVWGGLNLDEGDCVLLKVVNR